MQLLGERLGLRFTAGEPLDGAERPVLVLGVTVHRQHPGAEMRPVGDALGHHRIGDLALDGRVERLRMVVHAHGGEAGAERGRGRVPAGRGRARRHNLLGDQPGVVGQRLHALRRVEYRLESVADEVAVTAEAGEQRFEVVGRPIARAGHQRGAPAALRRVGHELGHLGEVVPRLGRGELLAELGLVGGRDSGVLEQVLAVRHGQDVGLHRQAVDVEAASLDFGGIDRRIILEVEGAVLALVNGGVVEDLRDEVADVEAFARLRIEDHVGDRQDLVGQRRHPGRVHDHDVVVRAFGRELGESLLLQGVVGHRVERNVDAGGLLEGRQRRLDGVGVGFRGGVEHRQLVGLGRAGRESARTERQGKHRAARQGAPGLEKRAPRDFQLLVRHRFLR